MSAERPVLYHNKPTCSKCGGALALLRAAGIVPTVVDITAQPLTAERLREIARMAGAGARAILRSGEPAYAELGLADASLDDDALFAAMAAHPELVERPLVVHQGRAVVGRPPERVLSLFDAG
jgi:arsenate reductase